LLNKFTTWIIDNQELFYFLFSGVGIMFITWLGRIFFRKWYGKSTQIIHSGDNSTNIQAGRNINIDSHKANNDGEKK